MKTYLVFTNTFGILRKADDTVKSARQWAAKAFARGEVVSVVPEHKGGTSVADLEQEWRQHVARRRVEGAA